MRNPNHLKKGQRITVEPRYLGVITVASDVAIIDVRDQWIGWGHNDRLFFSPRRLQNSAIAGGDQKSKGSESALRI